MSDYIKCAQCERPISDSRLILDKTNGLAFHLKELDLSQPIPATGSECVDGYCNRLRQALIELPTENVRDIRVPEPQEFIPKETTLGRGLRYALNRVGIELGIFSEYGTYEFLDSGDEEMEQPAKGGSGIIFMLKNFKDRNKPKITPILGVYNTEDMKNYTRRVVLFEDLRSGKNLRDIPSSLTDRLVSESRR